MAIRHQNGVSVSQVQRLLASAFEHLFRTLDRSVSLRSERDEAAARFFSGRTPDAAATARFEEWFLFERRSAGLGDVPAQVALAAMDSESYPADVRELLDLLGGQTYGAFELRDGDRTRIHDFLTDRGFPLDEEQADWLAGELDAGALLVGRLFPTVRGTYVFGLGVAAVSGEVAQALRRDLIVRRDALASRLSQLEMEKLLFLNHLREREGADGVPAAEEAEPLERIEAEVERWIRESGAAGLDMDQLREAFREAASVSEAVGPLLDEIAFETQADLEVGRRLLPAYYHALRARGGRAPSVDATRPRDELRARGPAPCPCGSGKSYAECCLPRDAVARFEAGRSKGQDLDELIRGLEAAMGLDSDDDEEGGEGGFQAGAPLGGIVEEYIWECQHLGRALPVATSRFLSDFAASIDDGEAAPKHLTELSRIHVARFLHFDRYRRGDLPRQGQVEGELEALRAFARWVRDEQGADWTEFVEALCQEESTWGERLAAVNAKLGGGEPKEWTLAFQITRATRRGERNEAELEAVHDPSMRGTFEIPTSLSEGLAAGDCLAVETNVDAATFLAARQRKRATEEDAEIQARLLRVFPPPAREFLARFADRRAD